MRKLFLTFLYSGLAPKAPGTFGTLAGAAVGILILKFLPVSTLFYLTLLITVIGINEINKEEKESGIHDSSWIVIDEVAGIWLAFTLSSQTYIHIIASIIFFRVYDIWKPSIIGRVDRSQKGGISVMGDDLLAGFFAGVSSAGVYKIIEYFQ